MSYYGVKQLAKLSGVSVRTLHYYDKIGLLVPEERTGAGYRYYGTPQLLRLQQILFYKELDFSLQEIMDLLDDPDFNTIRALEEHRIALEARISRISRLLVTIDNTIDNLKKGETMFTPENLYDGLAAEFATAHRTDAINKYGKSAVEDAEQSLAKLGKQGFEQLKRKSELLSAELFAHKHLDPGSAEVQELIAKHYIIIRQFWGTSGNADHQAEAYAGLGQLYADDPRFTMTKGEPQPDYAMFMKKAMAIFADTRLD